MSCMLSVYILYVNCAALCTGVLFASTFVLHYYNHCILTPTRTKNIVWSASPSSVLGTALSQLLACFSTVVRVKLCSQNLRQSLWVNKQYIIGFKVYTHCNIHAVIESAVVASWQYCSQFHKYRFVSTDFLIVAAVCNGPGYFFPSLTALKQASSQARTSMKYESDCD